MNVIKFALLVILVVILSKSCVLTETLHNFSTFCHLSFEGGGEKVGVKKENKGIFKKVFIRHRHFTSP